MRAYLTGNLSFFSHVGHQDALLLRHGAAALQHSRKICISTTTSYWGPVHHHTQLHALVFKVYGKQPGGFNAFNTHTHTHSHRVTKYLEVDGHGLASLYFPDDSQRQRQERPGLLKALLTQGTTPPFASIITHEVLDAS